MYNENTKANFGRIIFVAVSFLFLIVLFLAGCPHYKVYKARKDGEAVLAEAQSSREVAIAEARAKKESADLLAEADIIRARGVAKANIIIGKSLTERYLHWYWIDNLEKNPNAVIYVPTEANIPIMEAGRFGKGFKQSSVDSLTQ